MCKKCDSNCLFYPTDYSELIKEYTDDNGIKRREAVYLCGYDYHRIINFDTCNNYLEIKGVK